MLLIPIKEYSDIYNVDAATVRQKCLRGGYKSAKKIANSWFLDRDEPYINLHCADVQDQIQKSKDIISLVDKVDHIISQENSEKIILFLNKYERELFKNMRRYSEDYEIELEDDVITLIKKSNY